MGDLAGAPARGWNWASKPPMTPASTSPVPPVASAGLATLAAPEPTPVADHGSVSLEHDDHRPTTRVEASRERGGRRGPSLHRPSRRRRCRAARASRFHSPGCGVRISGPRYDRSGVVAIEFNASASSTLGRSSRSATIPTSRSMPRGPPRPGPQTIAWAPIAASWTRSSAGPAHTSSIGSGSAVASGRIVSAAVAKDSGTASTASPPPLRSAARAARHGPPSIRRGAVHPPITSVVPNVPLCPSRRRGGKVGTASRCSNSRIRHGRSTPVPVTSMSMAPNTSSISCSTRIE